VSSQTPLSDVLSEFARTMLTDYPLQGILDHLVQRIVDVLPISSAGARLIDAEATPRYIAASSEAAQRFQSLQSEVGQGPGVLACDTGEAVLVPDLFGETPFPDFASRALSEGLAAVFTFPLRNDDNLLGALDLYRDDPGPLDAESVASARVLADVTAVYLLNAQAREELKDRSEEAREVALHDPLTGLANRMLLLEYLHHAHLRMQRSGARVAVLYADLDKFKSINDSHGHRVGDELLLAVAARITDRLRPGDILARMSGDEFVVLCEDVGGKAEAGLIASRIVAAIAEPFELSCGAVTTSTSIGIAFMDREQLVAEDLIHNADIAMYQAKAKGGGRHQVINLAEQHRAQRQIGLMIDLRQARRGGDLRIAYQPLVRSRDAAVVGVEALLRWPHRSQGLVSSATLFPLVERAGLAMEIGEWVLRQACREHREWKSHSRGGQLGLSVNVSTAQLLSPGFVAQVEQVLLDTDADPNLLTFELTESALVQDAERSIVVLADLKKLGVTLALDDFARAFISLRALKRSLFDSIKLNVEFIGGIEQDVTTGSVVSALVGLAHALELQVVAEKIETAEQARAATVLGCDSSQGNYFARPMTGSDFQALLGRAGTDGHVRLPEPLAGG
jgi:diguanylate cyclase (GGDEF)-like protein